MKCNRNQSVIPWFWSQKKTWIVFEAWRLWMIQVGQSSLILDSLHIIHPVPGGIFLMGTWFEIFSGFREVGIELRTSPGHLSSTFCRAGQRCCPLHDTQHLKKYHQAKSTWDQLSFHKFPHLSSTQFAKKIPWPFLKPKNSSHKKLLSC